MEQNLEKKKKAKQAKKDDSPVESVWRDMLVDELPFSSKVHGAVQLWRNQRKEKKAQVLLARRMRFYN